MDKRLQVNGRSFYYRVIGSGPALVLLHGFAEYSHVWDPVLLLLDDDYTLLIPDLPGFGLSEAPESAHMDAYTACLWAMLDAEGIQQAVVMGHSMGGYVALQALSEQPARFVGLALLHAHAYADSEEKKASRLKSITFIEQNGAFSYIKSFVPSLFAPTTDRLIIKAEMASLEDQDPKGLQAALQAMAGRRAFTQTLSATPFPVLFVVGSHDQLMPQELLLEQAALPARSLVRMLLHSGHMGMLEQPREMARAMNEYLALLAGLTQ